MLKSPASTSRVRFPPRPALLDQMGELGIAALFRAYAIFRGDRMRQKGGMQIMGKEDCQFSGRSCPRVYALPANSRGRKQEKMMNIAFVNRVRTPFILRWCLLNFCLISSLEITQFHRGNQKATEKMKKISLDCIYM